MNLLIVLPVVIPFASAAAGLLAWQSPRIQRWLGLAGSFALLGVAGLLLWRVSVDGIAAVQIGRWAAPIGITFVADLFSAIMVLLAAIIAVATFVYSGSSVDARRQSSLYYPLLQIMIMGVCGAFLTGDIFNLYVWFEVLLISSFVLLALGGERPQLEGAIKYVTLNLMSSVLFLTAVGILYGMAGTLNMAHLSLRLAEPGNAAVATTVSMLFLVAFGIKAAAFPLFSWLPASYHTPPFAISAIFAGLLTKVGVYAIIRVFTLLFTQDVPYTHTIILVMASLTMVTGVLGAAAQHEIRRILSFHIISQVGYMILGLALFTPLALAGSVFYIAHHIIVKANLFFVSGVVHRLRGTSELKEHGVLGIYNSAPMVALLFLIPALSLSGIPPLSGFFAKLILIRAGLEAKEYIVVAVALLVGILTLFSMTKIWGEAFWKSPPADADAGHGAGEDAGLPGAVHPVRSRVPASMLIPIIALAIITVLIGLGAGPMFELSMRTAEQLLDSREYINAVRGEQP